MGVSCIIDLEKTSEGIYRPGSKVNGVIKYVIDEDTVFQNIVLSFKGKGKVNWSVPGDDSKIYYSNFEEYFTDIKSLLETGIYQGTFVKRGLYTETFNYILPMDIPSSYNDSNCTIVYYVGVKFTKAGVFNSNKKFKAILKVKTRVNPVSTSLSTSSCKVLTNLFNNNVEKIIISAVASTNFLEPGEEVQVKFEVQNDTGLDIKKISVYIIECLLFVSKRGMTHSKNRKINGCKKSIDVIPRRNFNEFTISVPSAVNSFSIQNSKIFRRDYKVLVLVKLPLPHRNASAEIPLVIGEVACTSDNSHVSPQSDTPCRSVVDEVFGE